MENPLNITALNDFIFCPISIYYHNLYDGVDKTMFQCSDQINGTAAHSSIDSQKCTGSDYILSLEVFCEKYNLVGRIDMFDKKNKVLIERKKMVRTIYDGYVFQLYAQYFALTEMGYEINRLKIHSMDNNKNIDIPLPKDDKAMLQKFEKTINNIENFEVMSFVQSNKEKCNRCIYRPYCDREA